MDIKKFFKVITCILAIEFIFIYCLIKNENSDYADIKNGNLNQNSSASIENVSYDVDTALNIELTGDYLDTYKKSVAGLGNSSTDLNRKLVAKIGLQILQSKVIKYENELHFYSLTYSASGAVAGAVYYDLEDCIKRINNGKRIYTDCFGFVRLTYSIACYTINKNNPSSVAKMSELYGHKGAYTGASITSINKLSCGNVIYDRLTGTGSTTNRHVAIFLYEENGNVIYMDQSRVFNGEHRAGSYIYSAPSSKAYKFNTYKEYCV